MRGAVYTNTVEALPLDSQPLNHLQESHYVSPQHLQGDATEFDFRYNHRETKIKVDGKMVKAGFTDKERTDALLRGIAGKRITYRPIDATA